MVTGVYKGLQSTTVQWVIVSYKRLQPVTRGYKGLQGVTGGYNRLQG